MDKVERSLTLDYYSLGSVQIGQGNSSGAQQRHHGKRHGDWNSWIPEVHLEENSGQTRNVLKNQVVTKRGHAGESKCGDFNRACKNATVQNMSLG